MEKIKAFLSKIKYYRAICILLSFILLILGIIFRIIVSYGSNKYYDQTVVKRWDKSGDSAHISVFLKESTEYTKSDVDGFKYELEKALDDNSVLPANEDARRYIIGYSTKSTIDLEGPSETINVNCLAVGEDFFLFHPVRLLNGSYFFGEDLCQDGVILDEETAFRLFGSYDVEGQQLLYGDRVLFVKGVYVKEDNKLYNYARGDKPEIFVPFDLLDSAELPLHITCLEICMPNPIDNFASKIVTDQFKIDSTQFEIVENSKRFGVDNLWMIYKNKKYRSMQNHDIIYPYWEKIARYEEDILAPKAVLMVIFFVSSGTIFISLLVYELSKITRLRSRNDVDL